LSFSCDLFLSKKKQKEMLDSRTSSEYSENAIQIVRPFLGPQRKWLGNVVCEAA